MTELEILKKYKLEEKFDQQIYSKNNGIFFLLRIYCSLFQLLKMLLK